MLRQPFCVSFNAMQRHRPCTCFHGFSTSYVVWVVEVRDPGLGAMAHAHFHFVGAPQLCKLLLQIIQHL